MKKLFLMSAFALMAVAANAADHVGTVLHTSCGRDVMTVAPEFFSKSEEFVDYIEDLNETYCGERKGAHAEARINNVK
jgi:hypothetical protein